MRLWLVFLIKPLVLGRDMAIGHNHYFHILIFMWIQHPTSCQALGRTLRGVLAVVVLDGKS